MIEAEQLEAAPKGSTSSLNCTESLHSRVLLIVNDSMLHLNLSSRLRLAGFEVAVTSSGELALQKLHSFNPHAVVLDLMIDEDGGDAVIKGIRRDPGATKLLIYAFSSSSASRSVKKAMKAGATRLFVETNTPLDDLVTELGNAFAGRRGEDDTAWIRATEFTRAPESAASRASLLEALGRVAKHLDVLRLAKGNTGRAAVFGELRGKVQPVLSLARGSSQPGLHRLVSALHSLLKVLHEMPECATESTQRTVSHAVEVLVQLCSVDPADDNSAPLELSAAVADNDMVSRSVVCSALRSVGFKFECFAHASVVLRYFDSNEADLVIVHLAPGASTDPEFATKLRAKSKNARTPVILVSGVSDFETRSQVAVNADDEVITKPFIFMELSVKALSLAIKKRLASKQPDAATTAAAAAGDAGNDGRFGDDSVDVAQFGEAAMSADPSEMKTPKLPRSRFKGSAISAAAEVGASQELANLREELEKKQQEREKLVSRIFNNELELDQIRTALDEEREHRQQLEQMVQDLMVGQAPQPIPLDGAANAGSDAAASLPHELLASLQTRLEELSTEADSLRAALEAKQQERQTLTARIFKDEMELDAIRAQLEQERTQREQLEANLHSQGGAATGDTSVLRDEVTGLRQAQEELIKQLAAAQEESEAEFRNKAELEVRLQELEAELKLATAAKQDLEGARQQLEAELQAKLANASEAGQSNELAQREHAQRAEQLEQELAALRQAQGALEARLSNELQAATVNAQRKAALEKQLAAAEQKLETALAEQHQLASERTTLAAGLEEQLSQLKAAAAAADAARLEEAERKAQLQKELDALWKAQEELDAQLAGEKRSAAEVQSQRSELETRWQQTAAQLEQSRTAIAQAEQLTSSEAARREALEAQLASLQAELDKKLSSQTQLSVAAGEQKADLEQRLLKLEEEPPLARAKISELTTERERIQTELTEQLKTATHATAIADEKARAEIARSQQLESELGQLRKAGQELDARLQAEQQRVQAATQSRVALEQQLQAAQSEIEQSRTARQALIEQHKIVEVELARQLSEARQQSTAADQKLADEATRNQHLSGELNKLQKSRQELETRLQSETKRSHEALAARKELEKNFKQTTGELANTRDAHQKLGLAKQQSEALLTGKLATITAEAAQFKTDAETATVRSTDLTARLTSLRETHDGLQTQLASEQSALAEAKSRGNRLETRLAETQVICEELRARLASERDSAAKIAQEKADLESQLAAEAKAWAEARGEFELQIANQKRREADLSQELSLAEVTTAQAETAHRRELERANKFEQEVTQLWQVRDDLKERVVSGQKSVEELAQQRAELAGRLAETSQNLDLVRTEAESAQAARVRSEEQSRELTAQNATLRSEAAVMVDRQQVHENELASMDRRVRDSLSSLARTTSNLETERGERRRIEQRAAGLSVQMQDLHRELNTHLEVEKENQARLTEVEQELATRVQELAASQSAHESERGQRRDVEQRAATLTTQIESLREELLERLRLEKATQARIANLEQQLRAREESLVRVTQHLETEREDRRRIELRAEGLIAQSQQLQGQLQQAGQREQENRSRIAELEDLGQARGQEIEQLQSGLATERGERRKLEERAQSLSVQLRELHKELDQHLHLEKEFQGKVSVLEVQLNDRQLALSRVQSDLKKESADRELAEEQLRAAGDISAKLQQYQASFEDARRAFDQTQRELESRLHAAGETAREHEVLLEREGAEKIRLQKELEAARREHQAQVQQNAIDRSKLNTSLQVESMERRRLEGDAMHSRYASLQSSRSGRALVNGFRRQLEQPVDQLMAQARRMLALEIKGDLKQIAESLMESAVTLQNSVRECDVVDLAAADAQAAHPLSNESMNAA